MFLSASPQIFKNAAELRSNPTKAEEILWQHLKSKQLNGIKFRRQHPVKKFILDFYSHEFKVGIELDGYHHNQTSIQFYDNDRSQILSEYGIRILRISNTLVFEDISLVKENILSFILKPGL